MEMLSYTRQPNQQVQHFYFHDAWHRSQLVNPVLLCRSSYSFLSDERIKPKCNLPHIVQGSWLHSMKYLKVFLVL